MPSVALPDGSSVQFPDGIDPAEMTQALDQYWGQKNSPHQVAPGAVTVPMPANNGVGPQVGPDDPNVKTGAPTAFPSFQQGASGLYSGAAQAFLHAIAAAAPSGSSIEKYATQLRDAFDEKIKNDEAAYQKNNPELAQKAQLDQAAGAATGQNVIPLDTGRLVGNIVAGAPLAALGQPEGLAARIGVGALEGGALGAAQPSDKQGAAYWKEKLDQATTGAVAGAVAAPVGSAVARVIKPNTSDDLSALVESGVKPTVGQLTGKAASRLEEGMTSLPIMGDAIKMGQRGAIEDFNRATINQALAPIGQSLGKDTPIGRQAIDEMSQKIQDAYNSTVSKLTASVDSQFASRIANLKALAQNLPGDYADQFNTVLKNEVIGKFSAGGTMSGQTFKDVESTLGQMATDYSHSSVVNERYFGAAVRQLQDEMRQLIVRNNPAVADALQSNNAAYAMMKRIQGASVSSVKNEGVFTPAQLLQSIRAQDPSLGKGSFARGNALMQTYAEAGENILGSKLPDSGTAFREMVQHPIQSFIYGTASPPAWLMYSPLGRKIASVVMASRPQLAAPIAQGVRNVSPMLGNALTTQQPSQ